MGLLTTPRLLIPTPSEFGWLTGTQSLSGATEKVAQVISAPKDGSIDCIKFATAAVTTGCTVECRLESLNANGDPSGSLVAAGASGTVVIANSDDQVWKTVDIGTPLPVQRGDSFAVVFAVSSGTPSSCTFRISSVVLADIHNYSQRYTGGAWTKTSSPMSMALRYSGDGGNYTYTPGLFPARTASSVNFASDTTPDEVGNKITVPFRGRFAGWWMRVQSATGDLDLVLYSNADAVLATVSFPAARRQTTGNAFVEANTDNLILTEGQVVRVVAKPTTTTAANLLVENTDAEFGGMAMGTNCVRTERTDAGAWTDSTTAAVALGIMLDQVDRAVPRAFSFA